MPRQNRVTPTGELVAVPARGEWMGNRGCLLDARGELVRQWRVRAWITCRTSYKGWTTPLWQPGRYTPLFFHDEAVALAAGHRPCALCRRPDFRRFLDAWEAAFGKRPSASELDRRLDADRRDGRAQRRHRRPWSGLPDGTFAWLDGGPAVVVGDRVVRWTVEGYGSAAARPWRGDVEVLTPSCTVEALRAGYAPQLDPCLRA